MVQASARQTRVGCIGDCGRIRGCGDATTSPQIHWRPGELDRCFASGWTALGSATAGGHVEALSCFSGGAKPKAQMIDGCDAIVVATQTGMKEALTQLMAWQEKQDNATEDLAATMQLSPLAE